MTSPTPTPLSYKDAGVDIDAGDALVDRTKPLAKKTMRDGRAGRHRRLWRLFEVPKQLQGAGAGDAAPTAWAPSSSWRFEWNMHDTARHRPVAMSVNDVLVQGAEPLFFLDYFACGKLDADTAAAVVGGIARGCELSGCALIGGETAEMPGMYPAGEYDLAGFAVGAVEKSQDPRRPERQARRRGAGPRLGRRAFQRFQPGAQGDRASGADLPATLDGKPFREAVMEPTHLYVKPVLEALAKHPIKALAHITGGGLLENIPRVLPEGTAAHLKKGSWPQTELLRLAAEGRRHRRHRDEPHLQQQHRHGRGDRRGRSRRRRRHAAPLGRDGA